MKKSILMARILGIALVFAMVWSMLPLGPFAIHSQVEASPDSIDWKGWWLGGVTVSETSVGEMVTAQVEISNEPSGYYRIRIMRDVSWGPDFETEKLEFNYDGGDHLYTLDFTTLIASGTGHTRGYYVDVCKKEWWGWAEKWKMPSSYPPRLKVLARELWIELTEAPEAIGGGGDVEFNENALYVIAGGGKRNFWKLDLSLPSWTTLASAPEEIGHGGSMTFDGEHYMYVVRGTSLAGLQKHNDFWRYDLGQNAWEKLPDTPEGVGACGSIVYTNGYVYLRPGGSLSAGFYRYNIASQTWEAKTSDPRVGLAGGVATAMTYDGERYIYTFQGGINVNGMLFDDIWRYDTWNDEWLEIGHDEELERADSLYMDGGFYAINEYSAYNFEFFDLSSQEWFRKPDIPCGLGTWNSIGPGASLAYDGVHYIYALNGGNDNGIWRYRIYRTPDFYVTAKAQQIYYKPQETTEVAVTVKNNRDVRTTLWLGVNLEDATGESTKYDEYVSITPPSATLDPGQSTTFSVTWTAPSDAPTGYYQIKVNCWKDSEFKQSYTDDLEHSFIFYVYRVDILTPTTADPATAGSFSDPGEVQVCLEWIPQWLLDPLCIKTPIFLVEIGHQQAAYELTSPFMRLFGIYTLEVDAPTQPGEGLYDLEVTATYDNTTDSDTTANAIHYMTTPSADPIEKGLAWLRSRQGGGSGWGDVGVRSLELLAFLNAGYDETDPYVASGVQFLLANVHGGAIYNVYYRSTYHTSLAMLALIATRNDDHRTAIENARDWLVSSQWDESCLWGSVNKASWYYGGFGYGYNVRPDLSNTQFALLALDAAGLPKTDSTWLKAQVFLHRTQKVDFPIDLNIDGTPYTVQPWNYASSSGGYDGGFCYQPGYDGNSRSTMTGAGIWCLLLSQVDRSDQRVTEAIDWVIDNYQWDTTLGSGGWRRYYYYLSMGKALTMYGQTSVGGHDWYDDLSDKIESEMIPVDLDKGYWSPSKEDYVPDLTTAYAILTLQTRTVAPQSARLSYLTFILRSHCLLRVLDPDGNLVGYNYATNVGENNVPTAVYSGPFSEPQYIVIVNPKPGNYELELLGISEGTYELTIQGSYGVEVTKIFEYIGEIQPAELQGSQVTVTAIVGPIDIYTDPPEFVGVINRAPTADAGEDQMVCAIPPATTAMVTLDGSGSYDPDGDPLTYNWTWDGNTAQGVNASVELPLGTTTITLVVNDGQVDSEPDTVGIIVCLQATVDFDPDTLNLKSKGKYVTAFIELPTGYNVSQIDIASIRLNDTVPALAKPAQIGDHDNDGIPDLMVKFDRAAVSALLTPSSQVEITISGEVAGIPFEGSDTIRVINP